MVEKKDGDAGRWDSGAARLGDGTRKAGCLRLFVRCGWVFGRCALVPIYPLGSAKTCQQNLGDDIAGSERT